MKKHLTAALLCLAPVYAMAADCESFTTKATDGKTYSFNYCFDSEYNAGKRSSAIRNGEKAIQRAVKAAANNGNIEPSLATQTLKLRNLTSQIVSRSEVCATPEWQQAAVKNAYENSLKGISDKRINKMIEKSYTAWRKEDTKIADSIGQDDPMFCQNINLRNSSGEVVKFR